MASDEEAWLPVPGWDGYYEVSDQGRVRSLPRIIMRSNGAPQTLPGVTLRPAAGKYGHRYVHLAQPGRKTGALVHRLVLAAFVGPCPPGMEGCHNDGKAGNNALPNLRWDTPSSNNLDRTIHGTNQFALREACPWGHRLAAPNLVAHKLKQGRRSCKACQAAQQVKMRRARKGLPCDDFQELADAHYLRLTKDADGLRPALD